MSRINYKKVKNQTNLCFYARVYMETIWTIDNKQKK